MVSSQYIRNEDVVLREVAGEKLLIPVKGRLADLQDIFVLEGIGEQIWSRLDGSCSVDQIASEISGRFETPGDDVLEDCAAFVQELLEEGLIVSA